MNLSFIRPDLLSLSAYAPTPLDDSHTQLIRLDANESPLNLPEELKTKLALFYESQVETNRYPDGSHIRLKNLIADYVNESVDLNHFVNNSHISVGNGSDELIRSVLMATCLNGQGSILVANPTFSMYCILGETLGIPVINIDRHESDFSWNIDKANQAINESEIPVKVVFVVHPNSPTANCLTTKEIDWLKSLPEDILVVIDEAYYEFSQQTMVNELANHDNWLILRTFSKAFRLASHRLGYSIASPEIIQILEKVRLPYNLPTFTQLAGQFALENRSLILPAVEEIMSQKDYVYKELASLPQFKIWCSDANFIYIRLADNPTTENHQNILVKLREQDILIRHTGGGLRISIGTKSENNTLLNKIKTIIS